MKISNPIQTNINGICYLLNPENNTAEVTHSEEQYVGAIEIPMDITHDGIIYRVTSIGQGAFKHCTDLTSVIMPNSVTSIGAAAFWWCTSLEAVNIPNSVTTIEMMAFGVCVKLKSVTLPQNLEKICFRSFMYSGLESITIPDSVKTIEGMAFSGCEELKNICFAGTIEQCQQIALDESWNDFNTPTKFVHCTDGDVEL